MKFIKHLSLFFIIPALLQAQQYSLTGKILTTDKNEELSFANVKVIGTNLGTAANKNGNFILKLKKGNHIIVASYIGYKSDTLKIFLDDNETHNFYLKPTNLELSEVTVEPGINPAYGIIQKTIKQKKLLEEKLENYKYSAYTKGIVRTTDENSKSEDKLIISSIIENESRCFFKKPDQNKVYIVARKQSANTPPFVNVATGGIVIQSFYEDNLRFLNKNIPSPISDEALDYYYFYIEKELAIDNQKVYQIYFNTDNTAAPGFYGRLFIADSTYNLLKVDAQLNQMANFGGLFKFIKVFQQFSEIDNFSMPIDYRVFAEGNYLGIIKFGFELHTLMSDYKINSKIDKDLFDGAIISVLPEADKKKREYWKSISSIPNTIEETKAYARIDSLEKTAKTFGQDLSFLAPKMDLNKNFAITGPLSFYSFNKVEGHTLNLDLYYDDDQKQRLNSHIGVSYGFADKKFKEEFDFEYLLGTYRTTRLNFSIFNKITDLFGSSNRYNKFTSTLLSLISKYNFRDYYYTKGLNAGIIGEVIPQLSLGLNFETVEDKSAQNNSDFSFFNRDDVYSQNKQIYDGTVNSLELEFGLDFRNFIEDGFFRRRITPINNIQFEGAYKISNKNLLKSDFNFKTLRLSAKGGFETFGSWTAGFSLNNIYSTGAIPIQHLYALPGNINSGSKNFSFRTLKIGEVFGDRITTLYLTHNFQDDLFRFLQIPFIKDLQIQLSTHLNIALSEINQESKKLLTIDYIEFKKPFYELGFSVGHLLFPLRFEFTWKLNYRGKNNFKFGINTLAL